MAAVIEVENLTKRYRRTTAVDDLSFRVEENAIYGFLGGNGAGKTTTMSMLTAQNSPTSGSIRVFGEQPYENARILSRMCFVRESQKYPDDFTPQHAFTSARLFFPRWDEDFAQSLIQDFRLPMKTTIKKLSRGQLSAVGVIIGLAARAEIRFSTSRTWDSTRWLAHCSTTGSWRTMQSTRARSSCRRTSSTRSPI